jgi:hypothetical protein
MDPDVERTATYVCRLLEALGIEYLIGGSVASSIHGQPRLTRDIDLVADLAVEQAVKLVESLGDEFYADEEAIRDAIAARSSFSVIHRPSMLKIDVFVRTREPWSDARWSRRQTVLLGESADTSAVVSSAEDMVLQKLRWYRLGREISTTQWTDIVQMLRVQAGALDDAYMQKWAAELGLTELPLGATGEAQQR